MNRYWRARKDFEELESRFELEDQVELDASRLELMQDPSHENAARLYEVAILLWIREHGRNWPAANRIAKRRGI